MAYVTIRRPIRPRSDDWEPEPPLIARDVIVVDDEPIKTGLLDQNGTPIYRTSDRIKLGFV